MYFDIIFKAITTSKLDLRQHKLKKYSFEKLGRATDVRVNSLNLEDIVNHKFSFHQKKLIDSTH